MFDKMIPVMTFKECGEDKIEYQVYLLNPGEVFAGFGGTRSGLLVRKTASLIIRCLACGSSTDVEYDIRDPNAWRTIRWATENCLYRAMGEGKPS